MRLEQLTTYMLLLVTILHIVIVDFKLCQAQNHNPTIKDNKYLNNYSKSKTEKQISTVTSNSDDNLNFEDYNDVYDLPIPDPLEPWNRVWFHFNDFLYIRILKPVYKGYETITPSFLRTGAKNFLSNIETPIRLINSILQGKFGQAWVELGKFIINSTVGFGGLINVAKKDKPRIPVDPKSADFGHTLAVWGFGEGIFIIWPVFGPSTIRDTFGMIGDKLMSPSFLFVESATLIPFIYHSSTPVSFIPNSYTYGTLNLYLTFNNLNTVLVPYESITQSAIEPYIALREAYITYRRDKKRKVQIRY